VGQHRDSNARDAAGPFPATDEELGEAMKRLRLPRTVRQVAAEANVSRSAWSRYENGQLVPLQLAGVIDAVLAAEGWIAASVARLRQPQWAPWVDQVSARTFAHRWPGPYNGTVWMHVVPTPQHVNETHRLTLRWGPWRREVVISPDRAGVVLMTGKARDDNDVPVVLHLDCDLPVYVAFGAGEVTVPLPALDIREGWTRP
jgi:hypothetical protein